MTPQMQPAQMQPAQQPTMQPHKPGINWMGVLADTLAGAAGREGPYMASMMAQQKQQEAAQAAAAQRQASMQDWQSKFQYLQDHKVQEPDNFTRTLQAAGIDPASPQGVAMFKKRAEMLTNPMQLMSDGYGGFKPVHANGEAPASGVATDDDWNSAKDYGGGASNGTGGFPR